MNELFQYLQDQFINNIAAGATIATVSASVLYSVKGLPEGQLGLSMADITNSCLSNEKIDDAIRDIYSKTDAEKNVRKAS